jgi:hypothetical protein
MPEPSTSPLIPQSPTLVGRSVFRGLVRVPFLFLNAMTKANNTGPSWCALYFLCLSQLLVHVATYGSNANTHGESPLRQICAIAI